MTDYPQTGWTDGYGQQQPGTPPPGYWQASDARWYPAELHPSYQAPAMPPAPGPAGVTQAVPSYDPPSYEQPSYAPPSYEPPSYDQPTYAAPSYDGSVPLGGAPAPAGGGGGRGPLLAIIAGVVALLVIGGAAFAFLSSGDDDETVAADGTTTTLATGGVDEQTTTTASAVGTDTTVAGGATAAGDTSTTTVAGGAAPGPAGTPDPEYGISCTRVASDMVTLEMTGTGTAVTSYFITIGFFDEAGNRLSDEFFSINSLRPGERTIETQFTFEEAGTTCQVLEVDTYENIEGTAAMADVSECVAGGPDFADDMEASIVVTNSGTEVLDYSVEVAFVDPEGIRRGAASSYVEAVRPGEPAPGDVFTTTDYDPALRCEVIAVSVYPTSD